MLTDFERAQDAYDNQTPPDGMSDREIQAIEDELSDRWHALSGEDRHDWVDVAVVTSLAYTLVLGALTDEQKYVATCNLEAEFARGKRAFTKHYALHEYEVEL